MGRAWQLEKIALSIRKKHREIGCSFRKWIGGKSTNRHMLLSQELQMESEFEWLVV